MRYSASFSTPDRDPAVHGVATHAGRYYSLGSDKELASIFPDGVAGNLAEEFATTGTNSLLIRPMGVSLVAAMQSWRHRTGATFEAAGEPVLDLHESREAARAKRPARDWHLPPRNAVVTVEGGDATDAGAAASEVPSVAPSGTRVPAIADPASIPFGDVTVLTGPPGVGKSAILTYAAHYARRNGWIVVYVPSSWALMHDGKVLVKSKRTAGMVDQHDAALRLLREIFVAHGEALGRVPQRRAYAPHRYLPRAEDERVTAAREQARAAEDAARSKLKAEAAARGASWSDADFVSELDAAPPTGGDSPGREGYTLRDVVEWGLNHPASATDALIDTLAELRLTTEYPVLIAIDGINLLYERSAYPEEGTGKPLPGERLSVPAAFQCLGEEGLK